MKETQILFKTDMVQALQKNKKDITRRVITDWNIVPRIKNCKRLPRTWKTVVPHSGGGWHSADCVMTEEEMRKREASPDGFRSRYGDKGDLLWVKETISIGSDGCYETIVDYKADGYKLVGGEKWTPSIFMNKCYCRFWLEIVDIRPERLHDITDEDAIREGIKLLDFGCDGKGWDNYMWWGHYNIKKKKQIRDYWPYQYSTYKSPRDSFMSLWQSINANRGYPWSNNDWVWRIEFKKIKRR